MPLWVFLSPEGLRWDERNLRRKWYRCLEHAGIREVRFHDLRHTFVSLLINKGTHPKYIQEQAGHSSIQVTMDTYGICSRVPANGSTSWMSLTRSQVSGLQHRIQRFTYPLRTRDRNSRHIWQSREVTTCLILKRK
ncbi:MAG: tyrosine-type recombinase/integrase [Nitrospira sp.]